MKIENESLSVGDVNGGSSVNQAGHDVIIHQHGVQLAEIVPLVNGLVKSELQNYQLQAELTAKTRLEEFSLSLVKEIDAKIADKVYRFGDPSMQIAARSAALGYMKSGDDRQKDDLIDLLIERTKTENRTSEQLLIDEAINILPKLSAQCIAILTLMTFSNLVFNGTKDYFEKWIKNMNPVLEELQNVKDIDIEYLVQADCISSMLGFKGEQNWVQRNLKGYPLVFSHDNPTAVANFLAKYGFVVRKEGLEFTNHYPLDDVMQLFAIFDVTTKGDISPKLLRPEQYDEISGILKLYSAEDIKSLIENRTPMTEPEITEYYKNFNPKWEKGIRLIESKLSSYELKLVGKYIGTRQLSKLSQTDVSLSIFLKD